MKKILKPPYSMRLEGLRDHACLIICTGSDGWSRAKSPTWSPGRKVVLPYGDDPATYDWRVAATNHVIIAGFGDLETIDTITQLAGLLLAVGSNLVLYSPELGKLTRFEARRMVA
jgi:hypothetical protein